MEENKLLVALHSGESMFARRTLMQLATKLAIGLGALFLVGVLLAAIPNHRAPVVEGVSAELGQAAQRTDSAKAPSAKTAAAKPQEKVAAQAVAHKQATVPKAGDPTK